MMIVMLAECDGLVSRLSIILDFFVWYQNRFGICYPTKVSKSVLNKFTTRKSLGIGFRKMLLEKVLESESESDCCDDDGDGDECGDEKIG